MQTTSLANYNATHFLWECTDRVATITLNRPDRKNPLTFESYAELRDLFRWLVYAEDIDVVVITGAGGNFCSGGDVHEIIGPLTKMNMKELMSFTRMTGDLVKAMRACRQPVISAVEGICAGAGAIIAIPDLNPLIKAIGGRIGLTAPFKFVQHRMMNTRAVLIYQSVCRDLHNRGLNGAMLYRTALALQQAGYRTLGGTWIADINAPSLRQVEKAGARPLHRLHLFTKRLAAA